MVCSARFTWLKFFQVEPKKLENPNVKNKTALSLDWRTVRISVICLKVGICCKLTVGYKSCWLWLPFRRRFRTPKPFHIRLLNFATLANLSTYANDYIRFLIAIQVFYHRQPVRKNVEICWTWMCVFFFAFGYLLRVSIERNEHMPVLGRKVEKSSDFDLCMDSEKKQLLNGL